MKFISTRGGTKHKLKFEEAILCCYADDGGLLMPETTPQVTLETLELWKYLSYVEIVKEVIALFASEDEMSRDIQSEIVDKSFKGFDTKKVVELAHLSNGLNVLELWHGDTLAFKDLAMTCTVQFLSYFLKQRSQHLTAIVVTTGDTGSSALHAARDVENIDVIVMYPYNRVTKFQELMTTRVQADNLHLYAVDGIGDDIEMVASKILHDKYFVQTHKVGTLNSMNWCRIMVQMAHHIYGYLQTARNIGESVDIIIPCGSCGNITACMVARDMGIPIHIIGISNKNDSFHNIVRHNRREIPTVKASLAPGMDAAFAQNVERIFWLVSNRSSDVVATAINDLFTNGISHLPEASFKRLSDAITTSVASDDIILEAMKRCWKEDKYYICPHTAAAVAHFYGITAGCDPPISNERIPTVCMATGDAAKFCEALEQAGLPLYQSPKIEDLKDQNENYMYVGEDEDWDKIFRAKVMEISSRWNR